MAESRFRDAFKTATLLAVLLFAQTVAISHLDTGDSHPAGEVCAVCIAHAQLGSANVAPAVTFHVEVQRAEVVDFEPSLTVQRRVEFRFARGPPQVS